MLRVVWAPVAIAALAAVGLLSQWPLEILVPVLSVLLLVGIFTTISYFNLRRLENSALKLKELATYFTRRFAGNSSLSVFAVIEGLLPIDHPGLQEWVRDCGMSQRIFSAWCEAFAGRIESDSKTSGLRAHTRTYLRELWSLVIQYQEFIEQFYRVAEKAEVPRETVDQYNRFVLEYNPFVQRFQEYIGKLRASDRTEIEPPSVKLAKELQAKQVPKPLSREERRLPEPPDNRGYILGRRPPQAAA